MSLSKSLRPVLLATTFSGIFLVLIKLILYPTPSKPSVTPLAFPSSVPLQEWQPLPSYPLVNSATDRVNYLSGRHYRYIQNSLPLDIEMRYIVDTDGEVKNLLKNYDSISASLVLRQKDGLGFYGLFTHQEKAYLSACINPYGVSTFTERQFKQNHNAYALQFNRLLPWLLGQGNLKDERCLWTNLSIPLNSSTSEVAYQKLETIWVSWYQWWRPRFPKV